MREALSDLLQVAGFASRAYADPAACLGDYRPGRFELLITDIRMPGMDGIELLGRLEAMDARLPAIIVTSSEAASRARATAAGALACLTKPVDDDALLRRIDEALARRGQHPER